MKNHHSIQNSFKFIKSLDHSISHFTLIPPAPFFTARAPPPTHTHTTHFMLHTHLAPSCQQLVGGVLVQAQVVWQRRGRGLVRQLL